MTQEPGKPGFFVSGRFAAVLAVLPVLEKLSGRGGRKKKLGLGKCRGGVSCTCCTSCTLKTVREGGGEKKYWRYASAGMRLYGQI